MKLSVKAFALAAGLFWGVTLFVSTLIAAYYGYLTPQLQWLVGLYPWYEITTMGAFIGLAEGFVDGFFGGLVFAWLYNKFVCSCGNECCDSKKKPMMSMTPVKKTAPKRKTT